ncbi:MAG: hypothetical protein KAU48_10605, partial [Candidatus Thorarchaeota archaeon]|nr:hypothetical protein [Candidatus Thorarchaeota archaeon]
KLILYFAGLGMIGGASVGGVSGAGSAGGVVTGGLSGAIAGGAISASQKGTIVSRCNTFAEEANENLQDAVDAVNEEQSSDDPRIFFAEPEFKDKNAIFADESWLWGIENDLGPADDDQIGGVETARQDACDDAGVDGVDGFMCRRASIGHPNVTGAEEYAKVIITELDKFYPEKP